MVSCGLNITSWFIDDQYGMRETKLILIAFILVARGSTVLAKSVTESRIKENLKIVDLDNEEVKLLTGGTAKKRYVYPPFGINFGFPDKLEGKKMKNGVPE